jgi:minor extracellular serine protease Vpr
MLTPRRVDLVRLVPVALVAAGALLLVVAAGGTDSRTPTFSASASAWRGLVGQRPTVAVGQRAIVVLKAPSLAQRVAQAGGRASDSQERAWTAAAIAAQRQVFATLGTYGIQTRVEFSFARVLNGFSAALDARAVALLERNPDVAGVFPVRVAYPASTSSDLLADKELAQGAGSRPAISLPGFDGRGVTIALLDTGVDRSHPYLRGRILDGIDVVGESLGALPRGKPDDPARLERHGTEMAGILVGAGGPDGLHGVAPGASVVPIRVAGWQHDVTGSWAVYARTDQLIAGLERAVDPNLDGDAHDAARVAVIPLAAPYAAFADAPDARAVEGALDLDTLVVTSAGNDGPAGPGYGSISSPGAAPQGLTVGAVDLRPKAAEVRVVLRSGLRILEDRVAPLAGAVVPGKGVEFELASPRNPGEAERRPGGGLPPPSLDDFFDARGGNLVAGRAALVPGRGDPELAAENAALAGATAVVLYGSRVPAGALGLNENISVPVVSIDRDAAAAVLAAIKRGERVGISIGAPQVVANRAAGRVASFSSRGLAFDSRVKPDLTAPGVTIATADAGRNEDGTPRYATVNGSSAAAASVAGAAALLAQARPAWDGRSLRSALASYARPLPAQAVTAQGGGLLDVGAAAAAEVVVEPTTLAFGRAPTAKWRARQTIVLRNVSTRRLRFSIRGATGGGAGLAITANPSRLRLWPGGIARVVLTASVRGELSPAGLAQGAVVVSPRASTPIRIPWTVMLGPRPASLLTGVRLSTGSFPPSDTTPAVLTFRAGKLLSDAHGVAIQPVARLDVGLVDENGEPRGLLARLRDLLPGRYALGLTGRDPAGNTLEPGVYTLRLTAVPPDNSRPTRRVIRFTIR